MTTSSLLSPSAVAAESPAAATITASERLALRSHVRALRTSAGYRAHLAREGVDPERVRRLSDIPYTDKGSVFGGPVDAWLEGGHIAQAAELLTSSGQSGRFSIGVASRTERRELERSVDAALRAMGGGEASPSLLLNCLPMGISVPTRLATVATPSVHVEMATEMLLRLSPGFDRTVIVAEPLFLKALAETALEAVGPALHDRVAACIVGGEWVAESWRRYTASLLGLAGPPSPARPGMLVSMGAAEIGLHALQETPFLRMAREALDGPDARRSLFGRDPGYTPSLLTWDPARLYLEERVHDGGERTVACTTLTRRLLPLVRYDLDDLAEVVPAEALNRELAWRGCPVRVEGPVMAIWGRRGTEARGPGWTLRPELIKSLLFGTAAHAARLTGRFRITAEGGDPCLHVQLRDAGPADARLERFLGGLISSAAGVPGRVRVHAARAYPFHEAGDFQHKPTYLERQP